MGIWMIATLIRYSYQNTSIALCLIFNTARYFSSFINKLSHIQSYAECPLPLGLQKWDSAVLCCSPRLTFILRDIRAVSLQAQSIACSLQLCIHWVPCKKQLTFKYSANGRYRKRLQQCSHPQLHYACMFLFKMSNKNVEERRGAPIEENIPLCIFPSLQQRHDKMLWLFGDGRFTQPWNNILFPSHKGSLILEEC